MGALAVGRAANLLCQQRAWSRVRAGVHVVRPPRRAESRRTLTAASPAAPPCPQDLL